MSPPPTQAPSAQEYFHLLERRLAALTDLYNSVRDSQTAAAGLSYEGIVRCNETTSSLCRRLTVVDREIAAIEAAISAGTNVKVRWNHPQSLREAFGAVASQPGLVLISKIDEMRRAVQFANHVYGSVLIKARRTLSMLDNVLLFHTGQTYTKSGLTERDSGASFRIS